MGVYEQQVGERITFATWMMWAVPIVLAFIPAIAIYLTRRLGNHPAPAMPHPGAWRPAEVRVLTVFALTALFWVTRLEPFGGWSGLFGIENSDDYMVAFLAVVVLFLTPDGKGERLLDWETAARIPWGMLILFGAGIAIAEAFTQSGLSHTIGGALSSLAVLPVLLIMLCICLVVTFLTETTSNTATTTLLMPILAAAGLGAGMDPKLFMIPAAMSASCAFMLPVATAPNVIVYSTGRFTIEEMAKEGLALNFLGAIIIATGCYLLLA
jgi:solute carrier family 13 (sodium-dependent dicarboxylate transporter), member 2/3/5